MNLPSKNINRAALSCPLPIEDGATIQLSHGGGGTQTHRLIESVFRPAFDNPDLETAHDGAVLQVATARLAVTTDSYVIRPLLFPGGDIGSLAVNGTVNDLAMCGAAPRYLSAAFILEEGLPIATLQTVVRSMRESADRAGVRIVTGDTKVVDRGKGDGVFINTTGVGTLEHDLKLHPESIQPGDGILLSGDLGRHGIAVMAARESLGFESDIQSDCAPLSRCVLDLIEQGIALRCLRDLTRGGLATALVEIAQTAELAIDVQQAAIPVREDVQGACEILGLDPLYVANEGRFAAFVKQSDAQRALDILRAHDATADARWIGSVHDERAGEVTLKTRIGTRRRLTMFSGEQLPRIC